MSSSYSTISHLSLSFSRKSLAERHGDGNSHMPKSDSEILNNKKIYDYQL